MARPKKDDPTLRFRSRRVFAETYLKQRSGEPWRMRDYQVASIESDARRKCHCDGRDVGKTSEIEIIAAWASICEPSGSMLIATMF
jgi:hypothetical protein